MIPLTLRQVAEAVGGRVWGGGDTVVVTGDVRFDSRQVAPGDLFVAVPGERVDGHEFAAAAMAAGAAGVLAARALGTPDAPIPTVVVPPSPTRDLTARSYALAGDHDGSGAAVLAGLAALARAVVDRLTPAGLTVIGVTGSSGKTSTKDLIAALLTPLGPTVAPPGSFNNEIGHPWTALRATETTRHLVLELSARGRGHVEALCRAAPPRIGVVLNVGSAHLGEFGSRAEIARCKGELVEALPPAGAGGVAVLNADDPLVAAMARRTTARVVLVGESDRAEVRAENVTLDESARATFRLCTPVGAADVRLAVYGAHQVGNALSAAAVALTLGADVGQVAESLAAAKPVSRRRMEVTNRADGVTVINDAYNANPESMRAALQAAATMARPLGGARRTRRCWAVLGQMAELGPDSAAEHAEIGRLAVRLNIDRLVVVGERARAMHHGASLEGSWGEESVLVADVDAAIALLRAELEPGDVVVVKASNAAGLWRVADALLDHHATEDAR